MKIDIITSKDFDRDFIKLYKRYKSLVNDLKKFEQGLIHGDIIGDEVVKGQV